MIDDEIIVTVADLRAARMCARQPRLWMKAQGLSWSEFVNNGYPIATLLATGDSLALPVIEEARKRVADER